MYFVYILYSNSADKYYIGYTNDYHQRVLDHNTQPYFNTYTSKYRPWVLSAVFECGVERSEAMKIEKFIKQQKSRRLIECLIDPSFVPSGALAQLVRVPDVRD